MPHYLEITDSTGKAWTSDSDELTAENLTQIGDLFSDFSELTTLSIQRDGAKVYFNPAYVISARVVEVSS